MRRSLAGSALRPEATAACVRSEEHTSELQSHSDLVCRLLLEKKKRDRGGAERWEGDSRHRNNWLLVSLPHAYSQERLETPLRHARPRIAHGHRRAHTVQSLRV